MQDFGNEPEKPSNQHEEPAYGSNPGSVNTTSPGNAANPNEFEARPDSSQFGSVNPYAANVNPNANPIHGNTVPTGSYGAPGTNPGSASAYQGTGASYPGSPYPGQGYPGYANPSTQPGLGGMGMPPVPPRRRNYAPWIGGAILIVALVVSMAVVQAGYLKGAKYGPENGTLPASHPVVSGKEPSPAELSTSFRAVAKAVEPAVVYISITETSEGSGLFHSFPGFQIPGGAQKTRASGSGVIVRPDGFILTNNHVVGKADRIDVTLADGRKFKATRVGTDPDTDLAVIKIDANSLPIAVLGDSDRIEQGDWVLAIGSPFGFQQTLTAGIVSATGRSLSGPDTSRLDRYIQTDASINPGNSGGPLVDMQGEVIGINTLIYSPATMMGGGSQGGNIGIGFAIPANLARRVYEQLASAGKVTRGYLGVYVRDLDEPTAKALNSDIHAGVLVQDLTGKDSPAARAGLRSGDIITAVNGKHVEKATELTDAVIDMSVGSQVSVEYLRNGEKKTTTVTLSERPSQNEQLQQENENNGEENPQEPQSSKLGITVQSVTPDMVGQLNLKISTGALVVSVEPGSPAEEAGLRRGDVIHRVGSANIGSANDLIQAGKTLKSGDSVAVQVERNGLLQFATINID